LNETGEKLHDIEGSQLSSVDMLVSERSLNELFEVLDRRFTPKNGFTHSASSHGPDLAVERR